MKFLELARQSLRITLGHWRLWALAAAMSFSFIPALLIGAAFGSLAAVLTLPVQGSLAALSAPLRQISPGTWLVLAALSLIVMVVSTAISCAMQAAAMRAAAAAAAGHPLGLRGSLRLGRRRFINILKVSLLYGVLIAAIALLPPLLLLVVPDDGFVAAASNTLGTTLAPLNSILGIIILLVLISIALEDVGAEAAAGRTWTVFKNAWKEFVAVTSITVVTGIVQTLMLAPFLVLLVLALLAQQGWAVVLLCGAVSIPLVLLVWLGTGVYALVLYTLVYQAAAQRAPAPALPQAV